MTLVMFPFQSAMTPSRSTAFRMAPPSDVEYMGRSLTVVTMSDCDHYTYGMNRMSAGETIPPGYDRSFRVSAGCWDVQVGYGWATGYSTGTKRTTVPAGRNRILVYSGD